MKALIKGWREAYHQADLPFIYAQLPNFMDVNYWPSESNWAALRESQLKSLSVSHTAMTVNIDLGEWNDIHPDNKKDVGERMALAARKLAYGEDVVYSGPLYKGHTVEGNKIIISFSDVGGGLIADDGEELSEFAIAGTDKKFVWAKARIEGDKVIVWNDEVTEPRYVRYAWADNPDNPNLYNKEGLPASPFRTDGN
jgi:sialate O-acetylesterase